MKKLAADDPLDVPVIADKAVLCMALLRLTRGNQKGVGPNRDDWPYFAKVATLRSTNQPIPKELTFMTRHRVRKYRRQLMDSNMAYNVFGDEPLTDMVSRFAEVTLNVELAASNKEQSYGDW